MTDNLLRVATPPKKRKSAPHKGWSLREQNGRILIRIRNRFTRHFPGGVWSEQQPKGTNKTQANEIARKQLAKLRDAKHGIENSCLHEIRLRELFAYALTNFTKIRIMNGQWFLLSSSMNHASATSF